jgi:hypothetical protein
MADVTSPPTPARPPMSFGAWLGVVLLFLFFGIFVLVLVAATPHGNNYEEKRAKAREEKLKTIRDTAAKDLNSYAWVDKSKGVARIPIEQAMEITIRDLASKKPAPANPIAVPAEAPAPAAGAALPAPAVSPVTAPSGTPKPTSIEGPNSENRSQPAAAANPPNAIPGTQPGPGATPAASASPPSGQAPISPSPMPEQKPLAPPPTTPAKSPS